MRVFFILLIVWLFFSVNFGTAGETCQSCHKDAQSNCNLRCGDCHLSSSADFLPKEKNHPKIIRNPSLEKWWEEKCESCHSEVIQKFRNSLHYSNAGIIDQTRYLWGKQDEPLKSNPEEWKTLRGAGAISNPTTADLADHLLASKCFGCHFDAEMRRASEGRKRVAGCAACHTPLDQQTGKPLHGHRFQKKVGDEVCLTCHSGNYVGGDYYGFFEHDYHREYQTSYGSKPLFGAYQHRLARDVHQQAGMKCMDCHSKSDVTGDNVIRHFEGERPAVRCEDCHGGFGKKASSAKAINKAFIFDSAIAAHQSFHARVSCTACHAQWSYQDYGLHLFLDETDNYEMWANFLWQGDGEVYDLLSTQLAKKQVNRQKAYSTNKLTGERIPGIWYKGWTFRRWETPILGVDRNGKFGIIRPLYQYYVTYVDSLDRVWLDSEKPKRSDGKIGWNWDVYQPHTIGKRGRNCESCHENPKAAGLGIRQSVGDSAAHFITIPHNTILPEARLLNYREKRRLLGKSEQYKIWRTRALKRGGIDELYK